jgi:hypothetical protein
MNMGGANSSTLPKPPLALKKNLLVQDAFNQSAPASTEALLKMADEGLANIEMELRQSQQSKKAIVGSGILKGRASTSQSTLDKIR